MISNPDLFPSYLLTFGMIFLAEIGDKSQLVCMTLASRHRAKPVLLGAVSAFALLNLLAVTLGTSLTYVIPETWLIVAAASLFALFGIQALLNSDEEEESAPKLGRSIFITTFSMIFVAELGDKTQLAVVSLSATSPPISVWMASTLALGATSAIGVFAGRTFFKRCNTVLLHKISGLFFITIAIMMITSLI
ncbi:TMEM165/GDT1 family protein [Thaumasiovibrio sp. DFM-14]|uniref:TMEM165/GDT1 family protein n=1 Tax=Thaumasiovibrio sp. DFM-14 TaxID=3384792 RepID=UPI0039A382B6